MSGTDFFNSAEFQLSSDDLFGIVAGPLQQPKVVDDDVFYDTLESLSMPFSIADDTSMTPPVSSGSLPLIFPPPPTSSTSPLPQHQHQQQLHEALLQHQQLEQQLLLQRHQQQQQQFISVAPPQQQQQQQRVEQPRPVASSASSSLSVPRNLPQSNIDASNVIPTIAALRERQFATISDLLVRQRAAIVGNDVSATQQVASQGASLLSTLAEQLGALATLDQCVVIHAAQLGSWRALSRDLALQHQQLQLLQDELRAVSAGQSCAALMALVVQCQPFPCVVSKGKQLAIDDQLVVQLLCASTASAFRDVSKLSASLVLHSRSAPAPSATSLVTTQLPTPMPAPQLLNDTTTITSSSSSSSSTTSSAKSSKHTAAQTPVTNNASESNENGDEYLLDNIADLDSSTLMARFAFKFASGTRKALASIRCAMYVRASDGTTMLCESDSSLPLVVSTNDNQWEAAAGVLAAHEVLGGARTSTRWPHVDVLRRVGDDRVIDIYDVLEMVRANIGCVAISSAGWWCVSNELLVAEGTAQRPIGSLWHNGLLYGTLSRADVERTLATHNVGVFMLRFSERNPGQIGVAYVATGRIVRHYLISSTDVVGPKRTIVDFVMEQSQFQSLLQYNETDDGRVELLPVPKHLALKEFAHYVAPTAAQEGYEPLT